MTFLFQHPQNLWLSLAVVILAVLLLVWGYRRSPLRGAARWLAFGAKALAWILLALCLMDPVWSRKQPKVGENEVFIVADNSSSLTLSESPGEPSRAEQIKQALHADQKTPPLWQEKLSQMFRVKLQMIDDRLKGVSSFSQLDFTGGKSELNRALSVLAKAGASHRAAAVVLITDGNATDTDTLNQVVKIPIFPVLVGKNLPEPDLRIVEHSVTQTAFEDGPVTVTAQVAGQGYAGREAAVSILDEEGKVVVTEKLKIVGDNATQVVRLRLPAAKPGVSFYRLVILESALLPQLPKDEWKTHAKEATLANNERYITVDRGAGPYRVLYVSGRPNWEYKFLRRALAGDDEVQMPSLIRIAKREPKFEWRGRTGETSNPLFRGFGQQSEAQRYDQPVLIRLGTKDAKELVSGFPKSEAELFGEYRAIIVDDLEASFFTQEQMNLMERFVSERGGALLMLGGQESYQAGAYEHTPIGRMLPIYLDRVSRAPAIEDGRFNLTREGWLEAWTRLRVTREEDEQRLAQMPGFYSINQTFSIKPGASVMATINSANQEALPALAAQRFGEGRTAALMVGDMWRWGMRDETTSKDLERAWRQLIRWLVVDVPDRIQFTQTNTDGVIKLEVRARDEAFQPMDDAVVKIEVTDPEGKKSRIVAEPSLKEAGLFEAEFFPGIPGPYRATATVQPVDEKTDKLTSTKNTGWVHDPYSAEFASLKPGQEWMQRIAQESGGKVLTLAELDSLPELLQSIRAPIEEIVTTPLWHTPWVFLLIVGLLCVEWILRRRGGLA